MKRASFLLSRIVLSVLTIVVAYLIPNLASFMGLFGCLGSTFIGFILPLIVYYKDRALINKNKFDMTLSFVIIIIGTICGIIGAI